ncbi:MAG TPA: tetratricopeptide repeat protein [Xanthobacteraceae bacterium]|nr:tetratricopeptide repeat protein [Xanthobacteraceae bacterium]
MSEIFSEIDEDLRRERLHKLWQRYSGLIVGGAIVVVAAVGAWQGYTWWAEKQAAAASAEFDAAAVLAADNKHAEAEAAFAKLATTAPSGYRGLARLRAAAEAGDRDPKAGVALYDAIAADTSMPLVERDIARVRAGNLLIDHATYADMASRLEGAAGAGRPFNHAARELLALSAWRAKDNAAAQKWLDMIAEDGTTPASLRQRAEALQALLPPAAKS